MASGYLLLAVGLVMLPGCCVYKHVCISCHSSRGLLQVLVHWACAKISAASDTPDEQLRDTIVARLKGHPGVRFATVAAHAQGIGRRGLAALLLEYESCAAEQVRPTSPRFEAECAASFFLDHAGFKGARGVLCAHISPCLSVPSLQPTDCLFSFRCSSMSPPGTCIAVNVRYVRTAISKTQPRGDTKLEASCEQPSTEPVNISKSGMC